MNVTPFQKSAALATGGDGPQDGAVNERVARIEALLPTLATKADMGELRADFEKGQKENRAWMLATVIALFIGILSVGGFFASQLRNALPASTAAQPIIIQIPPAATQAAGMASEPAKYQLPREEAPRDPAPQQ